MLGLCGQFEVGAADVLVGLKSKESGKDGELEEPVTGDVQVLLTSKEKATSIRGLTVSMRCLLNSLFAGLCSFISRHKMLLGSQQMYGE